ncbi:MAG TPA: imidazolonepropionase [Rhizomicrobium sp.]|jgi:imidazolonepropionase|nr:imidazolonepropionase [Rhizomicrobium sp.]
MWDVLFTNCHAATMTVGGAPYGAVREAALAIKDGRIAWIGAAKDAPQTAVKETRRLDGAWITPGLIDCHTHLVFGGNRAREWEMRAQGKTYEEIARAGGGILSTVRATRESSEDNLVQSAAARARTMAGQGATTIEIKSGYGLDLATETKMLRAAAQVAHLANVRVRRTFLGAHALPPEYKDNRTAYVDLLVTEMIPAIARGHLADAVDAFCETIAFTPAEIERVFAAAKARGLPVKLHAEQLSDQQGTSLACRHGALSADHLEHVSNACIAAMKRSGTVAVVLPCAFYFLRETKKPPIAKLREAGVPIAIATDCNPGTSPTASPLMALNMGCTLYGLTPEEALAGMTRQAARALGLESETGILETGKSADLAIWNIADPSELSYWIGADLLQGRYLAGRNVHEKHP